MNRSQKIGAYLLDLIPRAASRLKTAWLRYTYPFAEFGRSVSVACSCQIERSASAGIKLGDNVYLAPEVWIDVAEAPVTPGTKVVLGSGCEIGRRSTISAKNQVILESDVLVAPSVLIADHSDVRSNLEDPPHLEDAITGGRIFIGRNCWLGYGVAIVCGHGELILGRNCVVGANAVVTQSFPAFSVVGGNPAKLLKTYDQQIGRWVRANG